MLHGVKTILLGSIWCSPILFKIVAVDSQWMWSRNCVESQVAGKGYVSTQREQEQ